MSKYDEFDLDIRKNADTVNDAGDARSGLECATWSICVDLTISVFCLSAVLMAAQMRVLRRVRAVQEPAIRLCPHAIAIVAMLVGDKH